MTARKRIGVLIPSIESETDTDLMQGIHRTAKALGYDTIAITNSTNSVHDSPITDYILGEENIYRLAVMAQFDGIIFVTGRFYREDRILLIADELKKCSIPIVVLEHELSGYPCIYPPQREGIRQVTRHLIYEHSCKRLFCLTGPKSSTIAQQRLESFIEVLKEENLEIDKHTCIYGDFWKESPRILAEEIAGGARPMPDAIVCANDYMAMILCKALYSHGISVPEQIKVTGYDGSIAAETNHPSITTVYGKDAILGTNAVNRLHRMMHPEEIQEIEANPCKLIMGTSCGCVATKSDAAYLQNRAAFMEYSDFQSHYREYYMNSDFIGKFSTAQTLHDIAIAVDSLAYLLFKWKRIEFCLSEDWQGDFENPDICRRTGYSDNIICLLSKTYSNNEIEHYCFSVKELLPSLQKPHDPQYIVILPLHFQQQALGYLALTFDDAGSFRMEERCHNWCDAAANGIYHLKNRLYIRNMQEKIAAYSVRDPITGMWNRKGIIQKIPNYIQEAATKDCNVILITLTWNRVILSSRRSDAEDSVVMANFIQMCEKSGECSARIGDKHFVILMTAEKNTFPDAVADRKLLQLMQCINHMQGKAECRIPEWNTAVSLLDTTADIEKLLEEHISKTVSESVQSLKTDYAPFIRQIHLEMHMTPELPWKAETSATELGLCKSYFHKLYKHYLNITFNDDLIHARIAKAKVLLKTTNLRIQEISELCGYLSASHFMRQFKERMECTAIQFRQQNSETLP